MKNVNRVQLYAVVTIDQGDGAGAHDVHISLDYMVTEEVDALARALLDKKQEQHDAAIAASSADANTAFL